VEYEPYEAVWDAVALDLVCQSRAVGVGKSDVEQAQTGGFIKGSCCVGEGEWREGRMSVHFEFGTSWT
jgi:hypothetical protein